MVVAPVAPDAAMSSRRRPSGRTRRGLLRTAAAALGTGLATGTAGCLSGLPPLGQPQTYGRIEPPPADDPAYRRFLPAPSTVALGRDRHRLTAAAPGPVTGGEPEEFLARRAFLRGSLDHLGVGYERYDRVLDCDLGAVVEATFDPASVADHLLGSGYERDGDHRGFALFSRADVPRRAAVGDGVLAWSSRGVHATPDVEALVDAGVGERRRYHEASREFDRVAEAAGTGRQVVVAPGFGDPTPTDAATLGADCFRFDDDAAYQVLTLVFPPDRVPSRERLERAFPDEAGLTSEANTFDVSVDGRLATLEARVPLEGRRDLTPMDEPPQVTWGASFDADARTVELRHEAGEPVDAEWLHYNVSRPDGTGGLDPRPLFESTRSVGPGDAATVDLSDRSDATAVQVVLAPEECCAFDVLFDYDLEGAGAEAER
jgi:hypothetical protein